MSCRGRHVLALLWLADALLVAVVVVAHCTHHVTLFTLVIVIVVGNTDAVVVVVAGRLIGGQVATSPVGHGRDQVGNTGLAGDDHFTTLGPWVNVVVLVGGEGVVVVVVVVDIHLLWWVL